MQLHILDKTLTFRNESTTVEQVINAIEQELKDTQYVLSHLVVDGIEVYQEPHVFLSSNISEIKEIRVAVKTLNEFAGDVLFSVIEYLERAVPAIEKLSGEFYKGANENSWSTLDQLLEGIQWIMDSYAMLSENNNIKLILLKDKTWESYSKNIEQLQDNVVDLMNAVQNKDIVLLADILMYEIVPLFKDMLVQLNKLDKGEVDSIAH